ncbi:MAG: insulinase family protein [Candidatus Zixiibacteriota bacterium]|nr:MAG: insulinase family protein [candidate division Zixibacteria bacterium]
MKRLMFRLGLVTCALLATFSSAFAEGEFDSLQKDQTLATFRVAAVYENEEGRGIGAEFRHVPSNFVLDVLRIQSLPQGFIWVNTPPSTDMGRPHTLEHLVLGKGPKAQYMASYEDMSLASSSAGTGQTITAYHFYASSGKENFFELMEKKMDALLHPNYSDEEIRREMCNLGYSTDPTDGSIRLEEKGSVYTEMVSAYEGAWSNLALKLDDMMYGANHPLSNSSGGYPPAIREATAEDLKAFHGDYYHLNNMGMIISIPDEISLDEFLTRTSEIFARLEPDAQPGEDPATARDRFPRPEMAPVGSIAVAEFPHQNENEPGVLLFAWPPVLEYDRQEAILQELLIGVFASGESSNLYKTFINSQTRVIDLGSNYVFGWASDDQGCPFYIGFSNIKREVAREEMIDSVRTLLVSEIEKVGNYPDNSEELREFNERAANRILEIQRRVRRNLNSPPGFGFRGASWWWLTQLQTLYRDPGFRKQLIAEKQYKFVKDLMASGKNFWKDYIAKWKLLENKPYGVAVKARPDMITRTEEQRTARIEAYIEFLKEQYGTDDRDAAIEQFVSEYDSKTAVIDAVGKEIETPGFVDNPPLTFDEQLDYRVEELPGGGTNVVSTFDNITSGRVALAMNMNVVPESMLPYVAGLPTLLTEVGVIKDGKPVAFDKTRELIRQEILSCYAYYDITHFSERVELMLVASGSTLEESRKGIEWMATFLFSPDWRPENLARIRDAVDIAMTDARNGMRGSEEDWVDNPANAYWKQSNPLILSAGSFLTQQHDLLRLRWMLKEAADESVREVFTGFMSSLGAFARADYADRSVLEGLAARLAGGEASENEMVENNTLVVGFNNLPEPAKELVVDAAEDLQWLLSVVPDATMAEDWEYLCGRMSADLGTSPAKVLDDYKQLMALILRQDNVRGYLVGSNAAQKELLPDQNALVARFATEPSVRQTYSSTPVIHGRLSGRTGGQQPVYVGLINPGTRNGVFMNFAACCGYFDYDGEKLRDLLAGRLYGGGGAHSMFMKTWAAGLAYSNGIRHRQTTGQIGYYAERCPSLVQTMQFVIGELRNADPDSTLLDYAVAQTFVGNRAGASYESRGGAMAENLADGLTPELVTEYRQAILELRKEPGLFNGIKARMLGVYGRILPGLDPAGKEVPGGMFFMIGPEMQFESFGEYLKTVEGEDTALHRIYPRDFWLVPKAS